MDKLEFTVHEFIGRIATFNVAAIVLYAFAGTALAGWLTFTLWPDEEEESVRIIAGIDGMRIDF